MHRAVRLAEIEKEEGVVATYFVNPHSAFYNLFEPEIGALLQRILSLGHGIGLHFDAAAYGVTTWTDVSLEAAVSREQALLQALLQSPVSVVSWQARTGPIYSTYRRVKFRVVQRLFRRLWRDYVYCSDSNGYWRFKPMGEIIREGHERLHLLTHPEWWTREVMSPSERIDRAILGRARKIRSGYDNRLARAGRLNVKALG